MMMLLLLMVVVVRQNSLNNVWSNQHAKQCELQSS